MTKEKKKTIKKKTVAKKATVKKPIEKPATPDVTQEQREAIIFNQGYEKGTVDTYRTIKSMIENGVDVNRFLGMFVK